MFNEAFKVEQLLEGLKQRPDWKPFPGIEERTRWDAIAADPNLALPVKGILAVADSILDEEIDPLTGSMYMNFMTNGDRVFYEENYFRRRYELSHLVMAECLTAKGTYVAKIIDYIWDILGEVSWCVPAHNFAGQHDMVMFKAPNPWKADDPLPVPGDDYLDLFACETAATLAESCYLLKSLLLETVPSLYYRIHGEIDRRVLSLLEGPKLYGWYLGRNNWTAWCSHNLLLTACYVVDDPQRLASIALKLMVPMQRFFDTIEPSGACIEGPGYWVVSAGRLAGFVSLVQERFGLDLKPGENEKFRNFGEHILPLNIGSNLFVNFADGGLKIDLDQGLISRYAQLIGSAQLASLVREDVDRIAARKIASPGRARGRNDYARQFLVHLTRLLYWTPDKDAISPRVCEKSVFLADMQMLIARSDTTPGKGLMLSAIAGSNDPHVNHHSHNDVGHFSVCLDGEPLLIDLGQGAYSRATFTETRYDMWHISSRGHNVPAVNGMLQFAGVGAEARDVVYRHDGAMSLLSLDASPAYFREPRDNRFFRQISFDHQAATIDIRDEITLGEALTDFQLPLNVSDRDILVNADGSVRIAGREGGLLIRPDNLKVTGVDPVEITDPRHLEVWGPRVFTIRLEAIDLSHPVFGLKISIV
ncbi:heparinase II/III family protein [Martelella sp. HB161492]|uniref:heparinase II/III domain-containing protein n=1 Tax=Martelella sp. HB161492 TaxID=2720726 RepID=UPI001592099F|nr:heparinase II/III family protein [Martelella sp. HB161492]